MDNINNETKINGPINFFKLKNDKDQILYLFSDAYSKDYHICSKSYIDIDKYLLKIFKNTKQKYNFIIPDINDSQNKFSYFSQINKLSKYDFDNIVFNRIKYENNIFNVIYDFYFLYHNSFYFNLYEINIFCDKIIKLKNHEISRTNILNLFKKKFHNLNPFIFKTFNGYLLDSIEKLHYDIDDILSFIELNKEKIRGNINFDTESPFQIQKTIFIKKKKIIDNLLFIYDFFKTINIVKNIFSLIKKNIPIILYLHVDLINFLLLLLIKHFNFKIIEKSYSDKIIDNDSIVGLNKIIYNLDILNLDSYQFLYNYLSQSNDFELIHCIKPFLLEK